MKENYCVTCEAHFRTDRDKHFNSRRHKSLDNDYSFNNESLYKTHPIYNLYAANKKGEIFNINLKKPIRGRENNCDYKMVMVRLKKSKKQKCITIHRFLYECFNGLIPPDKEIDHINNNKSDNRLENLQLLSHQKIARKQLFIKK